MKKSVISVPQILGTSVQSQMKEVPCKPQLHVYKLRLYGNRQIILIFGSRLKALYFRSPTNISLLESMCYCTCVDLSQSISELVLKKLSPRTEIGKAIFDSKGIIPDQLVSAKSIMSIFIFLSIHPKENLRDDINYINLYIFY